MERTHSVELRVAQAVTHRTTKVKNNRLSLMPETILLRSCKMGDDYLNMQLRNYVL
jgi:hypothetical protein